MAKKATAEAVEVAPQENVFTLPAKHSNVKPLLWFDEKTGLQKEIRYATNQNSPFVPEQTGTAVLGRIIFRNGELAVPKEQQNLQKLLSLYHPAKDTWYYEFNPIQIRIYLSNWLTMKT